jgi:chromosome segregation ATPase
MIFSKKIATTTTNMETQKKYQHPLNVRNRAATQTEMTHDSYVGQSALSGDLDHKLRDQQANLERLKQEHEEAQRVTKQLEELNSKRSQFFSSQVEITEKLTNAKTLIERELLAMRKEQAELEQCHETFETHLKKIAKFDPETWTRENIHANLDKSLIYIDDAMDQYDEAANYFSTKNSAGVFGASSRKGSKSMNSQTAEFVAQLKNGLAFNLPILVVAIVALIVYLCK